jgi:RHS repeat-associated protein
LNFVGNVTTISSDPQGYNRNLTWDQANRITGIKIPGSTSPSITVPGVTNAFSLNQVFAYDQLDRITNFNAGVSGATTLATGMALLPNETFTYDGIGNRQTRTTQAPGVTSTQATSYTHTTGKHWLASSTGAVADTWAYDVTGNATYEANAALWGGYGSSGTTTSPIYATTSVGKTNRALVYTFDGKNRPAKVAIAAANTSQATTAASANTVTYRFNALGQRVLKVGAGTFAYPTTIPFSGTLSNPPTQAQLQSLNTQNTAFYANSRFVYDEKGRLLGEYSKDGKLIQETVWFDDLPVAILKPFGASVTNPTSGTTTTGNQGANNTGSNGNASPPAAPTSKVNVEIFYSHPDHLGTPRVITASTALAATQGTGITSAQTINKAVWRWDSDPFGSNATATSSPNENPNTLNQVVGTATLPYLFKFNGRFPGQANDQETGKHQNGFREYDPGLGRYVQSDPVGFDLDGSTFSYVGSEPTAAVDEDGAKKTPKPPKETPPPTKPEPPKPPGHPKLPGEDLKPPGTCSLLFHAYLQAQVNSICKPDPGRCVGDSCNDCNHKAMLHCECAKVRKKINDTCFRGGNMTHQREYTKRKSFCDECNGQLKCCS